MFKHSHVLSLIFAAAIIFPGLLCAQKHTRKAQSIFQGSTDIGATHRGQTEFDVATHAYTVTGGGADMWGAADAFHFSWLQLSGDVTLSADVHFVSASAEALKKAVLMVRQSLDPASAYADVAIHGDGHVTLQYRAKDGGKTEDVLSTEHASTRLRIERKGDLFTIYAGSSDQELKAVPPVTIVLRDPVYVGIGVCSHNADGVEAATFSNVRVQRTSPKARQ